MKSIIKFVIYVIQKFFKYNLLNIYFTNINIINIMILTSTGAYQKISLY